MADPVIGATVQVALEKLLSLSIEEVKSLRDCNKDLEMLIQNVSMIQAFIHDAERRQVEDQAVEQWLKRLERVAEDAENVFDEFRFESLKAKVTKIRKSPIRKTKAGYDKECKICTRPFTVFSGGLVSMRDTKRLRSVGPAAN